MEGPFFSVIVPVYNVSGYLDACMASVLRQPFADFEVLLVDDGSTDGSGELCDAYAKKDARVCAFHQANGGPGCARNTGLENAAGRWILFLDGDDLWLENCLTPLHDLILANAGRDVFVCRYLTFSAEEGPFSQPFSTRPYRSGEAAAVPYGDCVLRYRDTSNWAVWKLAVRRALLTDDPLLFLPDVRYGEDFCWTLRLFERCRTVFYSDVILCGYRIRPNSLSGADSANALKYMESMLNAFRWFLAHPREKEQAFILGLLADTYSLYMVYATGGAERNGWITMYPDSRRMMSRSVAALSCRRTKLIRLALRVCGARCAFLLCAALRRRLPAG